MVVDLGSHDISSNHFNEKEEGYATAVLRSLLRTIPRQISIKKIELKRSANHKNLEICGLLNTQPIQLCIGGDRHELIK